MKTVLAIIFFFFSASQALAANVFVFRHLGFSADGRYMAFVDSAVQDGSGFPVAYGSVVDVQRNLLVKSSYVLINIDDGDDGDETEAVRRAAAKLDLASFGIERTRRGTNLWIHLPSDLDEPTRDIAFARGSAVDRSGNVAVPRFDLSIRDVPAPPTPGAACWDDEPRSMLLATLKKSNYGQVEKFWVLQQDARLPRSRECAITYEPRRVINYNGALVVVIRYETPGFEGHDFRHMVVTHGSALK